MHRPWMLLVCLCQACAAFVFVPARTKSPMPRVPRVVALHARAAVAPASTAPEAAQACGWPTAVSTRRRRPSALLCSAGNARKGGVGVALGASGATPEDDPFRPARASVSPMVINAIVPALFKEVRLTNFAEMLLHTHFQRKLSMISLRRINSMSQPSVETKYPEVEQSSSCYVPVGRTLWRRHVPKSSSSCMIPYILCSSFGAYG